MNALMLLANYSGSYNSGNIMFNKSTKKSGIPRQNFLISCNASSFSALSPFTFFYNYKPGFDNKRAVLEVWSPRYVIFVMKQYFFLPSPSNDSSMCYQVLPPVFACLLPNSSPGSGLPELFQGLSLLRVYYLLNYYYDKEKYSCRKFSHWKSNCLIM